MSLLKCPKCGEMFSDSYKTCPFCEEDEAFANGGKKPVNPGRRVHRQKSPSILGPTLVLVLVLVAGVLVLGTILTLMGIRAAHHPDGTRPVTVIVLGCQVRSDGTPSRMLQDRIQAAYDYLSIHEEAVCVASGGQNNQEPTTEARCIRDTLVSMGIDPGRIYLEDASISTEENLAFSAEVIRREGLPTEVAIASDNFHQLRAGVWAEKDGLTPYSLGCASIWMLGPGSWAREAAALLYMGATGAL